MKTTLRLPGWLKNAIKFVINPLERKRMLREKGIRKLQDKAILNYNADARKLIVFLVTGADLSTGKDKISGGIISIVSLCQESASMKDIHGAEVIMSTHKNENLLFRHTQFENHTDVFRYTQLRNYFSSAEEILIHIPEFTCDFFLEFLDPTDQKWLGRFKKVQINILNQNIRLMPGPGTIDALRSLTPLVTITTAHQRYCTRQYREQYGVPLHKFSVWISPEKYTFKPFHEKENFIVISPDNKPQKQEVLDKLSQIPGLTMQVIRDLTYEQYKETIARAKWALTFGEGLDAYIIEPIFTGSVAFAVYNEEFFTPDFKGLKTIYQSYDDLLAGITEEIARMNDPEKFEPYQREQFGLCEKYYSYRQYRQNIEAFYKGQYTFP